MEYGPERYKLEYEVEGLPYRLRSEYRGIACRLFRIHFECQVNLYIYMYGIEIDRETCVDARVSVRACLQYQNIITCLYF